MPAISFQSVSKTYPVAHGGVLRALHDVSFDIEEGEFFGLLGPNGAGTTTLISILAGLARPTGRVAVRGFDVGSGRTQRGAAAGRGDRRNWCSIAFFNVREALRIQVRLFRPGPPTTLDRRAAGQPGTGRQGRFEHAASCPAA